MNDLGLTISPIIIGSIKDMHKEVNDKFYWVNIYFISMNVVGLVVNFVLYYLDKTDNHGVLDKGTAKSII